MKVVEEIIVLLISLGLFQLLFGLIIKWIFNKRTSLLDKTQIKMLDYLKEHIKEMKTYNKLIEERNDNDKLQNEKLDNILVEIKKANERELKRSEQIGAIINEEEKL